MARRYSVTPISSVWCDEEVVFVETDTNIPEKRALERKDYRLMPLARLCNGRPPQTAGAALRIVLKMEAEMLERGWFGVQFAEDKEEARILPENRPWQQRAESRRS